jgi:hypothetical protein
MSKKADFRVEPFVNQFGQVLKPGDEVIYAGTGWKSTRFGKGKFAGVYYGWGWQSDNTKPSAIKIENVPYRNFIWDSVTKTGYHEDAFRHAVLPLKRAFRLDTPLNVETLNKMM